MWFDINVDISREMGGISLEMMKGNGGDISILEIGNALFFSNFLV